MAFLGRWRYLSILIQLRPGEPLKLDLPPQTRSVLTESNILIDRKLFIAAKKRMARQICQRV